MNRAVALTASLALAVVACSSSKEAKRSADEELLMQVKIEAARRSLQEIRSRSDRKLTISADCKTAKMLFLADLKQHESKEAQQLATDLLKACQKAQSQLEAAQ